LVLAETLTALVNMISAITKDTAAVASGTPECIWVIDTALLIWWWGLGNGISKNEAEDSKDKQVLEHVGR